MENSEDRFWQRLSTFQPTHFIPDYPKGLVGSGDVNFVSQWLNWDMDIDNSFVGIGMLR